MNSARFRRSALAVVPAAFIGVFFLYPLVTVLRYGFNPAVLTRTWSSPATLGVLWFTLWQALVSTGLCLLLALPTAAVLARLRFRGRRLLNALLVVPFVLPTVLVASAFLSLMSALGAADRFRHTVWAILAAHVFFNYAIIARSVGAFWSQLDTAPEQAARMLGAGRLRTFTQVTLPRIAPAIVASGAVVMLFNFTSFGVILILGGPRRATLETEIWRFAVQRIEFDTAASLALLQLLCVLAIVAAGSVWQRKRKVPERLGIRPALPPQGAAQRLGIAFAGLCAAVIIGLPLAALIERSLRSGGGYSLQNYRLLASTGDAQAMFGSPLAALGNSLAFAATAVVIAVVVGALAAVAVTRSGGRFSSVFEGTFLLPLGVSGVLLGFGVLLALDAPPLDLRLSWWLVPITHALIGIPFVIRSLTPALRAVSERLREATAVLGALPFRVWREVDLPPALRGLTVGIGFAFAVSLGEFGATAFIARPERPTLPLAIFRLLSRPGAANFGQAMALSVILLALVATVVVLLDRFRLPGTADF